MPSSVNIRIELELELELLAVDVEKGLRKNRDSKTKAVLSVKRALESYVARWLMDG